jgi:pimeloyl-ACP methyl ester carboxylesterase
MVKVKVQQAHFKNGVPYTCFGKGSKTLLAFNGLAFRHEPPSGLFLSRWLSAYSNFNEHYTIYILNRKKGLPAGYSIRDMSEDYAPVVRDELRGPVDILGASLGGSIAQHFAADHPDLVRRLVIIGCGYRFGDDGKQLAIRLRDLTLRHKWRSASATLGSHMVPQRGKKYIFSLLMWFYPILYSPTGPSDGVTEIEAQLQHDFKERLTDIKIPSLVVGGDKDVFTPASMLRETAESIPNARLIIYPGMGHDAAFSKQLAGDVLKFLTEDS